jgi:hypothetical protein
MHNLSRARDQLFDLRIHLDSNILIFAEGRQGLGETDSLLLKQLPSLFPQLLALSNLLLH